jgi:RNase P/RNase MRP subunit p29
MRDMMREFIGQPMLVTEASGIAGVPFECRVVDESMNMLYVSLPNSNRVMGIQKRGLKGTLMTDTGEIALIGDDVRVRPEDRIKRCAIRKGGNR